MFAAPPLPHTHTHLADCVYAWTVVPLLPPTLAPFPIADTLQQEIRSHVSAYRESIGVGVGVGASGSWGRRARWMGGWVRGYCTHLSFRIIFVSYACLCPLSPPPVNVWQLGGALALFEPTLEHLLQPALTFYEMVGARRQWPV